MHFLLQSLILFSYNVDKNLKHAAFLLYVNFRKIIFKITLTSDTFFLKKCYMLFNDISSTSRVCDM